MVLPHKRSRKGPALMWSGTQHSYVNLLRTALLVTTLRLPGTVCMTYAILV